MLDEVANSDELSTCGAEVQRCSSDEVANVHLAASLDEHLVKVRSEMARLTLT